MPLATVAIRPATFASILLAAAVALAAAPADASRNARAKRPARALGHAPARPFLHAPFRKSSRKTKLRAEELVQIGGSPFVAESHYNDLKGASMELLRRYRPDKHFFLALGRDPAPIVAFLQNLGGPNLAVSFTASGKGWPATQKQWEAYFRALVPAHIWRSGRDIVLIDQTNAGSGRTISLFQPVMQAYLDSIGSKAKIKMLGFSTGTLGGGVELLDVNPYPDVTRYLYQPYEGVVSEYERHVPGSQQLEDVVPRPEYRQYRSAVMRRMVNDGALREEVARLPGAAATFDPTARPFRRSPARRSRSAGTPLGESYRAVQRVGADTLRRFSPRDHFFLGVGQSSTSMVAFLQNAGGPELSRYLPADGLSQTVQPEWRASYAHYLRSTVPSEVAWGYRKLVLVMPGATAYRRTQIQELVSDVLPHARVTVLGVGGEPAPGLPVVEATEAEVDQLLGFRARAPFAAHRVGADQPSALKPRRDFVQLRRELGNHMADDASLQSFLDDL